jgi:hypothetical protein
VLIVHAHPTGHPFDGPNGWTPRPNHQAHPAAHRSHPGTPNAPRNQPRSVPGFRGPLRPSLVSTHPAPSSAVGCKVSHERFQAVTRGKSVSDSYRLPESAEEVMDMRPRTKRRVLSRVMPDKTHEEKRDAGPETCH